MEESDVIFDFTPVFSEDKASCYMLNPCLILGPPHEADQDTPRVFHSDRMTILVMPDLFEKGCYYWSVKGEKGVVKGLARSSYGAIQAAFEHVGEAVDNATFYTFDSLHNAFFRLLERCYNG